MTEEVVSALKIEYAKYLDTLGVTTSLRSLGRFIGVKNPTELKKEALIEKIIAVLIGELDSVPPSKRGAPVKEDRLDPVILQTLKSICFKCGGVWILQEELKEKKDPFSDFYRPKKNVLAVHSSASEQTKTLSACIGQLEKTKNFYCLFPLDGRSFEENIVIDERIVQKYGLKEGDVISGYKRAKGSVCILSEIRTINGMELPDFKRSDFEESEVCVPSEKISLKNCKYLDWFLPIAKGGRCLIVSPPKAGKTSILKEISKACIENPNLKTLGLLIEQPIETVSEFRKLYSAEDLVYTTYEEEPDVHIFIAEFILKRAKSYVEAGKDVCLIMEGLQSLANAYDEVNFEAGKVLSCGLSAKTVRYIKKYLASARDFEGAGSLTIVCTAAIGTGNNEDDLFVSEISSLFNTQICLSEELSLKRMFPAIDWKKSFIFQSEKVLGENLSQVELLLREEIFTTKSNEEIYHMIEQSDSFEDFEGMIFAQKKK